MCFEFSRQRFRKGKGEGGGEWEQELKFWQKLEKKSQLEIESGILALEHGWCFTTKLSVDECYKRLVTSWQGRNDSSRIKAICCDRGLQVLKHWDDYTVQNEDVHATEKA